MRRPRNLVKRGGWYYARVLVGGKLYRRALGTRNLETARDCLAAVLDDIELEHRQTEPAPGGDGFDLRRSAGWTSGSSSAGTGRG